jgi:hypothetical protein
MVDHALRQRQRAVADGDGQPPLALRVHRDPDPLGHTLPPRDGLRLTARAVLDRAKQGAEFVQLYLPAPHVVQDVSGKGLERRRRCDQPLQPRIGLPLTPPRRAPDTQPFGPARDAAHDELDGGARAGQERAAGLQKVAVPSDAQQLSPGTPMGRAIGAEIAPAPPAPRRTVRIGADMGYGGDRTPAPARHDEARWRRCGSLRARGSAVRTGIAGWLAGEARKEFRLAAVRTLGGGGRAGARSRGHAQ